MQNIDFSPIDQAEAFLKPLLEDIKQMKDLANTMFQQKKYKESIKILSECIDSYLSNEDVVKQIKQMDVLWRMKKMNGDGKAKDKLSNIHLIYSNRSISYLMNGQYQEAFKDASQCIDWNPGWPKGYFRKAHALMFLNNFVQAHNEIAKGLDLIEESRKEISETEYKTEIKRFSDLKKEIKKLSKENVGVPQNLEEENYVYSHHTLLSGLSKKYNNELIFLGADRECLKSNNSFPLITYDDKLLNSENIKTINMCFTMVIYEREDALKKYLNELSSEVKYKYLHEKDPVYSFTVLHIAVITKAKKCIDVLLNHGASPDEVDMFDLTPLSYAVGRINSLSITKTLIDKGLANVQKKTPTNANYLHTAAAANNYKICKYLVEVHNLDVKAITNSGDSPVDLATSQELIDYFNKSNIKKDKSIEKEASGCNLCSKISENLKRCAQCKSVMYCSVDCQKKDWKNHKPNCQPVLKNISIQDSPLDGIYHSTIQNVIGSQAPKVRMSGISKAGQQGNVTKSKVIVGKRVVVKIQNNELAHMVYNHDRTFNGYIRNTEQYFKVLDEKIKREGILGQKAYFYATINDNDTIDVEIGKLAPSQSW